jgi:AAA15 family ATPase/GTPase
MAHLNKLGLENFRVFKDYAEIEFAPITILTGANNSGKSSFVKTIQLLKFNLVDSNAPSDLVLSFISDTHKLSSFSEVVNDISKPIKFVTSTIFEGINEILTLALSYRKNDGNLLGEGIIVCIELFSETDKLIFKYSVSDNMPVVFTDFIYFFEKFVQKIKRKDIEYKDYQKVEETVKNHFDFRLQYHPYNLEEYLINSSRVTGKLSFYPFPILDTAFTHNKIIYSKPGGYDNSRMLSPRLSALFLIYSGVIDMKLFVENYLSQKDNNIEDAIISYLKVDLGKTATQINKIKTKVELDLLRLCSDLQNTKGFIDQQSIFGLEKSFNSHIMIFYHLSRLLELALIKVIYLKNPTEEILDLLNRLESKNGGWMDDNLDFLLRNFIGEKISVILENTGKYFKTVNKIDSVRANTKRLYTYSSQGTAFNSLLLNILQENINNNPNSKRFLKKWLRNFGIKGELEISNSVPGVGMLVTIGGRPLADLGYGLTQLIPILLEIILTGYRNHDDDHYTHHPYGGFLFSSTLIIEEPETNLHPKYQSMLAELFVDASKQFEIQFILETHSEYLIRKLQYLTGKGDLKPADTSLYYFYHPDEKPKNEKQVKKIEIMEDGRLSDCFGQGFFDEADNLATQLYLQNINHSN